MFCEFCCYFGILLLLGFWVVLVFYCCLGYLGILLDFGWFGFADCFGVRLVCVGGCGCFDMFLIMLWIVCDCVCWFVVWVFWFTVLGDWFMVYVGVLAFWMFRLGWWLLNSVVTYFYFLLF